MKIYEVPRKITKNALSLLSQALYDYCGK